jgi:hypothetical protein
MYRGYKRKTSKTGNRDESSDYQASRTVHLYKHRVHCKEALCTALRIVNGIKNWILVDDEDHPPYSKCILYWFTTIRGQSLMNRNDSHYHGEARRR